MYLNIYIYSALCSQIHIWVNSETILKKCIVGVYTGAASTTSGEWSLAPRVNYYYNQPDQTNFLQMWSLESGPGGFCLGAIISASFMLYI